jgi:hypothetical protein
MESRSESSIFEALDEAEDGETSSKGAKKALDRGEVIECVFVFFVLINLLMRLIPELTAQNIIKKKKNIIIWR